MSEYLKRLESDEFFDTLTRQYVEDEIVPRVSKALSDFGWGWYDAGEINSREIDAMIMLIDGRL